MSRLAQIFETKREEVAQAKSLVPLAAIRELAADADPPRGFLNRLKLGLPRLGLIAEVKKASPSRGMIREDFDPEDIAKRYESAGADALSVLTDEKYFMGSENNLRIARAATTLPCLRKDFIFDPYQVFQSRSWGADAVLLIVASLEDGQICDLMALAEGLGMDALVEVHDSFEAERAMNLGAKLIGANNRSLVDFSVDLTTSETILPKLTETFPIAESAMESAEDVERMKRAGAKAVLIGTAFGASHDIEAKVKEVMNW